MAETIFIATRTGKIFLAAEARAVVAFAHTGAKSFLVGQNSGFRTIREVFQRVKAALDFFLRRKFIVAGIGTETIVPSQSPFDKLRTGRRGLRRMFEFIMAEIRAETGF